MNFNECVCFQKYVQLIRTKILKNKTALYLIRKKYEIKNTHIFEFKMRMSP